ncbi:hypothetical protein DE146DRAFT_603899, partial [Phaeosphaeria sp. MPI-PUGE-AT-0046c]
HLLPHTRVYILADHLGIDNVKPVARQGVVDVLHVHLNNQRLKLRHVLDLAFSATPAQDRGIRYVLVDRMIIHPSLRTTVA